MRSERDNALGPLICEHPGGLDRDQPGELRAQFARLTAPQLAAGLTALWPRPGDVPQLRHPRRGTRTGPTRPFLGAQLRDLDEVIVPLVTAGPGSRAAPPNRN
jgi:hypothetical protein